MLNQAVEKTDARTGRGCIVIAACNKCPIAVSGLPVILTDALLSGSLSAPVGNSPRSLTKSSRRRRHFHEVMQHEQQRCLHAHLPYAPAHYRAELQVAFKVAERRLCSVRALVVLPL